MSYYYAYFERTNPSLTRAHASLYNSSSNVDVRIKRIYVPNDQFAAAAGGTVDCDFINITGTQPYGGVTVSKRKFDSNDAASDAGVTLQTGSIVTSSLTYKKFVNTGEEGAAQGTVTIQAMLAVDANYQLLYESIDGARDITLHKGEGIALRSTDGTLLNNLSATIEWVEVPNNTLQVNPPTYYVLSYIGGITVGDQFWLFNTGSNVATVHRIYKRNVNTSIVTPVTGSGQALLKKVSISANPTVSGNNVSPYDSTQSGVSGIQWWNSDPGGTYALDHVIKRFVYGTNGVQIGALSLQAICARNYQATLLYDKEKDKKPLVLRQNEGLVIETTFVEEAVTSNLIEIEVVFTV